MVIDRNLYKTQREISEMTGMEQPNISTALSRAKKRGHKTLTDKIGSLTLYHVATLPENIKKKIK